MTVRARIAVLVPVYNAGKYLRECLESIIGQTFADFELFVCNDGSTDESLSILKEYADRDTRVRVLENPRNEGIVATRNNLLAAIPDDAEFIAWIDADDIMVPDRLQRQLDYLDAHPELCGVGSSLEIIDENSRATGYRHYPETPRAIRKALPRHNVLAQSALMLRTSMVREVGTYSAEYPVCEDYDFWLRALSHHDFANFKEPVLRYRMSSNQSKQTQLKETLLNTIRVQKKYLFPHYFSLSNLIFFLMELSLLLLPSRAILYLFQKTQYSKESGDA